jgi:hypothetical protein
MAARPDSFVAHNGMRNTVGFLPKKNAARQGLNYLTVPSATMIRRTFLSTTALWSALSAAETLAPTAAYQPKKAVMKFGCQSAPATDSGCNPSSGTA